MDLQNRWVKAQCGSGQYITQGVTLWELGTAVRKVESVPLEHGPESQQTSNKPVTKREKPEDRAETTVGRWCRGKRQRIEDGLVGKP